MEAEDIELIEDLEKDVRLEDIAKRHKISIATIRNHIKKLEEENIILGKKYRLRYKRIGMQEIILGLEVKPENLLDVINKLKKEKAVKELYRTSGDHVLIAMIIASNEGASDVLERIKNIEGVSKIYPSFVEEIEK
jgi:Lrp/AsnC family transcriptional regulator for asnA, asnC and gidA